MILPSMKRISGLNGIQPLLPNIEYQELNDTSDNHWDDTSKSTPGYNVTEVWNSTTPGYIDILAELSSYSQYQMAQNIGIYTNPILFILGTIGNFLSVLVMTRTSMIKSSTCYYMAALAVADTSVLFCACLRTWLSYIMGYDLINTSAEICKIISFMCYWSFSMAAWILVAMTIDRYIVIHYPLMVHRYSTIRRTQKVMLLLCFLLIGFTMHYLFTVTINEDGICQAIKEHKKEFLEMVWPWLDATVYCFLPFVILVIFNGLIIYDHHKAVKRRSSLQPMTSRNGTPTSWFVYKNYSNTKLTLMLLVVSISFLLTSSPKTILVIIRPYIFDMVYEEDNGINYDLLANYSLASAITDILMYANHSLNFILYCLSGSKFREELKRIIMICVRCNKQPKLPVNYGLENIRRNSSLSTLNTDISTFNTDIDIYCGSIVLETTDL